MNETDLSSGAVYKILFAYYDAGLLDKKSEKIGVPLSSEKKKAVFYRPSGSGMRKFKEIYNGDIFDNSGLVTT